MVTHSSILPENSMDRGAWRVTVHRAAKSQIQLSTHTYETNKEMYMFRIFADIQLLWLSFKMLLWHHGYILGLCVFLDLHTEILSEEMVA